jgi:predicted acylesterase/phospholipase RssA
MKRRRFLALTAGLALAKSAPGNPGVEAALVLGGGGCRGYGHIGVLRVLERERLRPDLVVGSSSGALVGARKIQDLPMRFAAVAIDLKTGTMKILSEGDLGRAVQDSSSIPGLLEPVRIDGGIYVDGNLSAPVPVQAARKLGARGVVAVDVTFLPEQADLGDPFDALYQGFSILTRRLALEERALADRDAADAAETLLLAHAAPKRMAHPYSKACFSSATRSSTFSMPTDSRTSPSSMPRLARTSAGSEACVMIAGCSIRLSTPPRLSASVKSLQRSRKRREAGRPPLSTALTMPP